ncbi:MAG: DUF4445 domain-containing protein, partial [Candidatus Lokiarchaeota archaeon]|nr:DUF4445 domain-containing protein [Candidatus Lokiarchaeota archaeon]
MDANRITLILEPISKRVSIIKGNTIYDGLLALNYPIGALCGGQGKCGKCIVRILDEDKLVSEPTSAEKELLGAKKLSKGYRLACQTKIFGRTRVYLSENLLPSKSRILINGDLESLGITQKIKLDPRITKIQLTLDFSDLEDPKPDLTCFEESLKKSTPCGSDSINIDISANNSLYSILKSLPYDIRADNGDLSALFTKKDSKNWELFGILPKCQKLKLFGLAVDIGTTTIVGYLIDLESGEIASVSALLNPQVAIGEDLVSRITYIKKYNARDKAQHLLLDAINQIIEETTKKAKISRDLIVDVVIVGNTGMHHMFFGLPTEYLAKAPFVPVFKAPINISAENLHLILSHNVNVYSPPVIAGYVGTDTIGCAVSSNIHNFEKFSLLIDIGTNGELVIGNKYGLSTGSCAAGSALEGAHIQFGMRAAEGSIENVDIDRETLDPTIKVIGNVRPVGICG